MQKSLLVLSIPFLVALPACAAEQAVLHFMDGRTQQATLDRMKNDTVYVEMTDLDGQVTENAFHKSLFERVALAGGKDLDLSESDSPPDLNHGSSSDMKPQHEDISPTEDEKDLVYSIREIGVNNLTANGLSPHEAVTLTDVLRTELGKTGKFRVLERTKMHEILKEQGFQQSGACSQSSCIVEIGQLLGVPYMVMGSVGLMGRTYSINVRIVDVATGAIIRDISELHRGEKDRLLSAVMPRVARRLAGEGRNVARKERGAGKVLLIGGGALLAAGAGTVVYFLLKEKDNGDTPTQTGEITVTW